MEHYMSNKKVTYAQGLIDQLPGDIISRILNCLPLNDAAKMCPISRTWFYAWKRLPELKFDAKFFSKVLKNELPTIDKFCYILSLILMSHVGPITQFHLCIPVLKSSTAPGIDPWISYVGRNNVKDIIIRNMHKPLLKLSYHLFSCLDLERLKLYYCIINWQPFYEVLRNLKKLKLVHVTFIRNSLTDFIASCPVLQTLTLVKCKGIKHLDITAPNLKHLLVLGKFVSVCLRSAENLISLSITLEEMVPNHHSAKTCGIGRMFRTHYRSLKSLELSNVNTNDRDEFNWVVGLIKSCPFIEYLKISFSSVYPANFKVVPDPACQLSCLRKVHVTSVMGVTAELSLIEFLLRCSPTLDTMYIEKNAKIMGFEESGLTQALLYYRRASPEAKIVCKEGWKSLSLFNPPGFI